MCVGMGAGVDVSVSVGVGVGVSVGVGVGMGVVVGVGVWCVCVPKIECATSGCQGPRVCVWGGGRRGFAECRIALAVTV